MALRHTVCFTTSHSNAYLRVCVSVCLSVCKKKCVFTTHFCLYHTLNMSFYHFTITAHFVFTTNICVTCYYTHMCHLLLHTICVFTTPYLSLLHTMCLIHTKGVILSLSKYPQRSIQPLDGLTCRSKRPSTVSKRPSTVSKETYYSVKRDLERSIQQLDRLL